MHQSKLVIIHHSRVKRPNRSNTLATIFMIFAFGCNIQMKHSAHIINPGYTLETQRFLTERVHPHSRYTVLDGLLEDIRLGYLDKRRMNGRGVWNGGLILLLCVWAHVVCLRRPQCSRFVLVWRISGIPLMSGIAVDARISRDAGISYFRDLRFTIQEENNNALSLKSLISTIGSRSYLTSAYLLNA